MLFFHWFFKLFLCHLLFFFKIWEIRIYGYCFQAPPSQKCNSYKSFSMSHRFLFVICCCFLNTSSKSISFSSNEYKFASVRSEHLGKQTCNGFTYKYYKICFLSFDFPLSFYFSLPSFFAQFDAINWKSFFTLMMSCHVCKALRKWQLEWMLIYFQDNYYYYPLVGENTLGCHNFSRIKTFFKVLF
jgi:hypothetical protein